MANRHPDTNLLISVLKDYAELGQVCRYQDMSAALNRDVHKERHRITSAINFVQREYGYVAQCVHNIGYKFVKNNGVAAHELNKFKDKLTNHVARFDDKISTIDTTKVSESELKKVIEANIVSSGVWFMVSDGYSQQVSAIAEESSIRQSNDYLSDAKAAVKLLWNVS